MMRYPLIFFIFFFAFVSPRLFASEVFEQQGETVEIVLKRQFFDYDYFFSFKVLAKGELKAQDLLEYETLYRSLRRFKASMRAQRDISLPEEQDKIEQYINLHLENKIISLSELKKFCLQVLAHRQRNLEKIVECFIWGIDFENLWGQEDPLIMINYLSISALFSGLNVKSWNS